MTVGDRSGALALERLASWLRQAPEDSALRPREEFRHDLRERLLTASAAASSVSAAPSVSPAPAVRHRAADLGPAGDPLRDGARSGIPRRARRLGLVIRVGVAAIAATTVVSGVAIAAERALPGDTLYGVKRAAEGVQLQLTGDDTEAGLLHLQFAATRLQEVRRLVQEAGEDAANGRVRGALREMDAETTAGAGLLTRAYLARPALSESESASRSESPSPSESASPSPLSRLVAFTRDQERTLTTVLPALPAPAAASSLAVLRQVQTRTTALLASPTPGALLPAVQPVPTLPAAPSGRPTWMPGQPTPVASTPRSAPPPSTSSSATGTAPVTATATGRPGGAPADSPKATGEPTPSQAPSTPTSTARPGPAEQATPTAGAAASPTSPAPTSPAPASPAPTSPAPTSPAPTSAGAAPADHPADSLTGSAAIPDPPRVGQLPALRWHGPR